MADDQALELEDLRTFDQKSKTAIVAVHGVSDQKPFSSARAIANILLYSHVNGDSKYTSFVEKFIRIIDRPLKDTSQNPQDIDLKFISKQINQYKPNTIDENIYHSIRLESKCICPDNKTEQTVHIYEMYWADLSRLGTGFIRIFGELYQLLFHLISLGDLVLEFAYDFYHQKQDSYQQSLKYWQRSQLWTGNLLSLFIPILNLVLLIAAFLSLPVNIPEAYLPLLVQGIIIIILVIATGLFLLKQNNKNSWTWLLLPIIVSILGIFLLRISNFFAIGYYRLIAIEWLLTLGFTCWILFIKPYDRHNPGVIKVSKIIVIPLLSLTVLLLLINSNSAQGLTQISLNLIEVIYLLLFFAWLVFNIMYFVTMALSCIAINKLKHSNPSNPTYLLNLKKAAWTARLSLAVPAILFLFLTLTLWQALANIGVSLLLKEEFYKPLVLSIVFPKFPDKTFSAADFVQNLTEFSASPVAVLVVIVFLMALIIALWSLVPGIVADIKPPNTATDQDSSDSEALGNWLTNGFIAMIYTVSILLCLIIPLLFLTGFILYKVPLEDWNGTQTILNIAAGVLTASATSLIAFGDRLNKISFGLRGVLDVALDVDNYLRLYPKEDNPRARIFARYVSLLRYLCQWRDSDIKFNNYVH